MVKNKDRVVSVPELVAELKIPGPFLRKILQVLNKKHIVRSLKGNGGGFTLDMRPEKIFLLDVARIFQGTIKLNECTLSKKRCPLIKACALSSKINNIEKDVIRQLRGISVALLIKQKV